VPVDPGRLAAVLGEFATRTLVDVRLDGEQLASSAADLAWRGERTALEALASVNYADAEVEAAVHAAERVSREAANVSVAVARAQHHADQLTVGVLAAVQDLSVLTARWSTARVEAETRLRSAQVAFDSAPSVRRASAAEIVARARAEVARCQERLDLCERASQRLSVARTRAADAAASATSARQIAATASSAAADAISLAEEAVTHLEVGRVAVREATEAAEHVQNASREVSKASREVSDVGRRTETELEDLAGQLARMDRGPR